MHLYKQLVFRFDLDTSSHADKSWLDEGSDGLDQFVFVVSELRQLRR